MTATDLQADSASTSRSVDRLAHMVLADDDLIRTHAICGAELHLGPVDRVCPECERLVQSWES